MLHDACVEVTCDAEKCMNNVYVMLEWKYRDRSELSGFYDADDEVIEEKLVDDEWTVRDGKHFCSETCAG